MGSVLQAKFASEIAQWQYLVALYRLSKEAHSPSSKSRINKHTRALSLLKKNLQIILCWLFWWYWWWCLQAERGVPDRQSVAEWWKPGARESLCNCTHRSTYRHHHCIVMTENCLHPRNGHGTNFKYIYSLSCIFITMRSFDVFPYSKES